MAALVCSGAVMRTRFLQVHTAALYLCSRSNSPFFVSSFSSGTTDNNMYKPVVVCGPSGVGKGTLIDLLMKKFPNQFGFSVSHTTRPPRPGEQDGVHYHFTTIPQMQQEIADKKFIEHAEVHGKFYGTRYEGLRPIVRLCLSHALSLVKVFSL